MKYRIKKGETLWQWRCRINQWCMERLGGSDFRIIRGVPYCRRSKFARHTRVPNFLYGDCIGEFKQWCVSGRDLIFGDFIAELYKLSPEFGRDASIFLATPKLAIEVAMKLYKNR